MNSSTKRTLVAVWLVVVLGLGILIVTMRAPRPQAPRGPEASAKKISGSGHMVAVYRIVWPSDEMPRWDPHSEHILIKALPWKGAGKDCLAEALHDPSSRVDLFLSKQLRDGLELVAEEHDNAQHRSTDGSKWFEPTFSSKISYRFTLSGGYLHMGWVSDQRYQSGYGHGANPFPVAISPQEYLDNFHELVKLPNGTYERRVYVIAVS